MATFCFDTFVIRSVVDPQNCTLVIRSEDESHTVTGDGGTVSVIFTYTLGSNPPANAFDFGIAEGSNNPPDLTGGGFTPTTPSPNNAQGAPKGPFEEEDASFSINVPETTVASVWAVRLYLFATASASAKDTNKTTFAATNPT